VASGGITARQNCRASGEKNDSYHSEGILDSSPRRGHGTRRPGRGVSRGQRRFPSRPHARPAAGARSIADRQRQPGESTCRHGRRHPGAFLKGGASRGSSRTSMPARGVRPAAWLAFRRGVAGEQAATGGSHWPCSGRAA
jgi:hypothetical protein